jgi:hypothetical protein
MISSLEVLNLSIQPIRILEHVYALGSKNIEITFAMNWLVSVMYQFPVSYADEVEYVIVYEPSKLVLTAVSYVFPDGLVMMA